MHIEEARPLSESSIIFLLDKIRCAYKEQKNVEICVDISLDEIMSYFLSPRFWPGILDSLNKHFPYRTRQELMDLEYYDDILEDYIKHLHSQGYILSCTYIGDFDVAHPLNKKDALLNMFDPDLITSKNVNAIVNSGNRHFYTKENILLHVWCWQIKVPVDLELRLILSHYRDSERIIRVWENCFFIDNSKIVGWLGGKTINKYYGERETDYFKLLHNLVLLNISEDKNERVEAQKIVDTCTREQAKELQSYFHEVTDEQIISYANEKLHFVYNKVWLYSGK